MLDALMAHEQTCAADARGLMRWMLGLELPFPFTNAASKFDTIRTSLESQDIHAFEAAALRVVGLGPGLTPSGDDFLAGIFYVLARKPIPAWSAGMAAIQNNIHAACQRSSTACAASHLRNAMNGDSFDALADLMTALDGDSFDEVLAARETLLDIGSSSGSDMLAGVLTTLIAIDFLKTKN